MSNDEENDVFALLDDILNDREPEQVEPEESGVEEAAVITPDKPQVPTVEDEEISFDDLLGMFDEDDDDETATLPPLPAHAKDPTAQAVEQPDTSEEVAQLCPEEVAHLCPEEEPDTLEELLSAQTVDEDASQDVIFKDAAVAPEGPPMPVFTDEEIMESIDIRNFATLVTLNTARWHGKVKDRKAAAMIGSASGADPEAFETRKKLLAGAEGKLKAVHKTIDDARTRHYQMTLPWSVTGRTDQGRRMGGRLLPNTMFQEYIQEMSKAKQDMDVKLAAFVADYINPCSTGAVTRAREHLGTRFDPTEYPNPSSIGQHFGLSFDFHPVPVGEDFKGLADQQISKLSNTLAKKNRTMLENAMQELWARTYELVSQAADRFGDPDAMFHYTLIDKLREASINLKNLNVIRDPCVENVRLAIEKHLTMHDAKDIRADGALRKRLGQIAKACLKEMNDHANK